MNIAFTAHCVGCTLFRRGVPGFFHPFNWSFKFGSYERAQVSSIATIRPKEVVAFPLVPVQQDLCDCVAVPLLHLGYFMGIQRAATLQ